MQQDNNGDCDSWYEDSVNPTLGAIEGDGNVLAEEAPLVQYEEPMLLRRANKDFYSREPHRGGGGGGRRTAAPPTRGGGGGINGGGGGGGGAAVSAVGRSSARAQRLRGGEHDRLKDVLLAMLPNRQWADAEGNVWAQTVRATLAGRQELVALKDRLNQRLADLQARPDGVDPVREQLAGELFDEIIRQATVESPERGLLLLRCRDQLRLGLNARLQLYGTAREASAQQLGAAQELLAPLQSRLEELQEENEQKRLKVKEMQLKLERRDYNENACSEAVMDMHKEKIEKLRSQRKMLETYINSSRHKIRDSGV